jgi:hypothetical protein
MLENIIKGWVLSLIGLAGFILVVLHASGFYEFPNPEFLDKTYEVVIAFIVCIGFFILPKTKIDLVIEKLLNRVVDLFTGSKKKESNEGNPDKQE